MGSITEVGGYVIYFRIFLVRVANLQAFMVMRIKSPYLIFYFYILLYILIVVGKDFDTQEIRDLPTCIEVVIPSVGVVQSTKVVVLLF